MRITAPTAPSMSVLGQTNQVYNLRTLVAWACRPIKGSDGPECAWIGGSKRASTTTENISSNDCSLRIANENEFGVGAAFGVCGDRIAAIVLSVCHRLAEIICVAVVIVDVLIVA